ncbi:MAG: DUF4199 domain-containing protein [Flavobacteriales bacterium]|nr:DUF4199 domain-containing protein [Flavobacteriales bacterium]
MDNYGLENPNVPKLIPALIYGGITTLITVVIMLTATWSGWDMNSLSYKGTVWLISGTILFVCIKDYRDNRNNKRLRIGQSVGLGALMGLVSGILGAIFFYFFITYIHPEFMTEATNQAILDMEKRGMTDEQIEQGLQVMSFFMGPVFMGMMVILFSVLFNLIVGLIFGAILKRD